MSQTQPTTVPAIRQTVTVGADGKIELSAPELRPGMRAEVIVLMGGAASPTLSQRAAFEALQKSLHLSAAKVEQWTAQARQLREGWSRP